MNVFDLQERLIDFSVQSIRLLDKIPNDLVGKYLKGQLVRSSTSPALNYAEARDAESRADFLHKIKIVLKELRETHVGFSILLRLGCQPQSDLKEMAGECDQLIAIFKKSYITARANRSQNKKK